jgi:hypothetical protein
MINPIIYTDDGGLTYRIEFERTKDNISFQHHKTVKYLTFNDLLKVRDRIEKITIKFTNDNSVTHNRTGI